MGAPAMPMAEVSLYLISSTSQFWHQCALNVVFFAFTGASGATVFFFYLRVTVYLLHESLCFLHSHSPTVDMHIHVYL